MFIESATSKNFYLAPAERNIVWSPRTNNGNIALRWSASYRVRSTIYKHLAPLERKLIPLLHLKVEFTNDKWKILLGYLVYGIFHFGLRPGFTPYCCSFFAFLYRPQVLSKLSVPGWNHYRDGALRQRLT